MTDPLAALSRIAELRHDNEQSMDFQEICDIAARVILRECPRQFVVEAVRYDD